MSETKRVLITGASDGIGMRLADLYARDGYEVIGIGSRTADQLPETFPNEVVYKSVNLVDVAAAEQVASILNEAEWDTLDHLILNAGTGRVGDPAEENLGDLHQTLIVNLNAPITITHSLFPMLEAGKGCVTFIGSVAHKGAANFASYAASKGGLHGFVRALEQEWKNRVAVQIIHLGPVATDMHEKAGLKIGWQRKLFLTPEFAAKKIKALANAREPFATVSFGAWAVELLWRKLLRVSS